MKQAVFHPSDQLAAGFIAEPTPPPSPFTKIRLKTKEIRA